MFKNRKIRNILSTLIYPVLLVVFLASCSDEGCIDADDFGEYDREVFYVQSNFALNFCSWDDYDSSQQGSGMIPCMTTGIKTIDINGKQESSDNGCVGFNTIDLAQYKELCKSQCLSNCYEDSSTGSGGDVEPSWKPTTEKGENSNRGLILYPNQNILIKATGTVILTGGSSSVSYFSKANEFGLQNISGKSVYSPDPSLVVDVKEGADFDLSFYGRWCSINSGCSTGQFIGSDESYTNLYSAPRRLVAYIKEFPEGYNTESPYTGTPLFPNFDAWQCRYNTDTLTESECKADYSSISSSLTADAIANADEIYTVSSAEETANLGTVGGMVRWENDGAADNSSDPFVNTTCFYDVDNTSPTWKEYICSSENNLRVETKINNSGSYSSLRFKVLGPSQGEPASSAVGNCRVTVTDSQNNSETLTINADSTEWQGDYKLKPNQEVTLTPLDGKFAEASSGTSDLIDCNKALAYRVDSFHDIQINKSGLVSFKMLGTGSGSSGRCTINARIINTLEGSDSEYYYEYADASEPIKDLVVNASSWTSKDVYVRKGQIIRFNPSSWNGTWKPTTDLTRNCGIGMAMKIMERPAYLCKGYAYEEVANDLCILEIDSDGNGSCASEGVTPYISVSLPKCYNLENYISAVRDPALDYEYRGAKKLTSFDGIRGTFDGYSPVIDSYDNNGAQVYKKDSGGAVFYDSITPVVFNKTGRLLLMILDGNTFLNVSNIYNNAYTSDDDFNSQNGYLLTSAVREEFKNGENLEAVLCRDNDSNTACNQLDIGSNTLPNGDIIRWEPSADGSATLTSVGYGYHFDDSGSLVPNYTHSNNPDYENNELEFENLKKLRISFKIKDPDLITAASNQGCNIDGGGRGIEVDNPYYGYVGDSCPEGAECTEEKLCKNPYYNNYGSYKVQVSVENPAGFQALKIVKYIVKPVVETFDGRPGLCVASGSVIGNSCYENSDCSDSNSGYSCVGIVHGVCRVNDLIMPTMRCVNDSDCTDIFPVAGSVCIGGSPGVCASESSGSMVCKTDSQCESLGTGYTCDTDEAKAGVIEIIYSSMVSNPEYKAILRIVVILMVTFYGFGFLLGINKLDQSEVIMRIFKIGLVYTLVSQGGWEFFNHYVVTFFKEGVDYIVFMLASAFADSDGSGTAGALTTAMQNNNFYDKSILFVGVDKVYSLFFRDAVQNKILALLFTSLFGWLYYIIIWYSMLVYTFAVANALLLYLTAQVFISLILGLAPLFFLLLFFEQTKKMFDKWLGLLIGFALQQILLLTTLGFFSLLMYEIIRFTLGYTVCWVPIWTINTYVLGKITILSCWKVAGVTVTGGYENAPGIFRILMIFLVASIMKKFIVFMVDVGASLGGGVSSVGLSSKVADKGRELYGKTINKELFTGEKKNLLWDIANTATGGLSDKATTAARSRVKEEIDKKNLKIFGVKSKGMVKKEKDLMVKNEGILRNMNSAVDKYMNSNEAKAELSQRMSSKKINPSDRIALMKEAENVRNSAMMNYLTDDRPGKPGMSDREAKSFIGKERGKFKEELTTGRNLGLGTFYRGGKYFTKKAVNTARKKVGGEQGVSTGSESLAESAHGQYMSRKLVDSVQRANFVGNVDNDVPPAPPATPPPPPAPSGSNPPEVPPSSPGVL